MAAEEQQQQPVEAKMEEHEQQQQDDDAPKLSKRQQKRMLKMERNQEAKRARKEAQKGERQKALEEKRNSIDTMLASMTEEQRAEWRQKQKEKQQQMAEARAAAKARNQQALSAPQKVVIDLGFAGLMTSGELRSLCQQLSYSYSIAVNGEKQLHLHLLGGSGDLEAALQQQLSGHVHWAVTKSDKDFKDFFKDRLSDLVYLTADSPNELDVIDPSKVYILGGLVDRNRHKGICYKRACEAGVATARLPITQHMKLHTSAVITVNQVVDILSRLQVTPDWHTVLEAVLPGRKRADGGQQQQHGSRSSSKEPSPAPTAAPTAAAQQQQESPQAAAAAAAGGQESEAAADAAAAGDATEGQAAAAAGGGEAAGEPSAGAAATEQEAS